jgi:hypothetical protein
MDIHMTREDAGVLRDLLQQRIVDLDKEISRTDRREFKKSLSELNRTIERLLRQVSAALEVKD